MLKEQNSIILFTVSSKNAEWIGLSLIETINFTQPSGKKGIPSKMN